MKIIWTLLLAIGGAALSGKMHAVPPSQTVREASSVVSAATNGGTAKGSKAGLLAGKNAQGAEPLSRTQVADANSIKHHALNRGNQIKAVRPAQHPSVKRRTTADMSHQGMQQVRQVPPTNVHKGPPMQIAASHIGPTSPSFRSIRPNTQLVGAASHRGINSPAISGAAMRHQLNTGAIDGSGIHRKP